MNDRRMHGLMERGGRPPAPRVLLGLQVTAVVILVGWALHATASVSSLLAAAFFVAVMLAPMDAAIAERAGGRRWVGHLVSLLVMIVALLIFALGLLFAAQRVASEFPALSQLPTEQIPGVEA